ncbi:MAG: D-aminoacyl-tRNA deacylase [Gemmatimonadota bacterium]
MRVLLQRVARASVTIEEEVVGEVGRGLLLLVGFTDGDDRACVEWMADKVRGLRVFTDDDGKMNRSVEDVSGGLLIVSQFTLYGNARKGRRPSFVGAAHPDIAIPLYESFVDALRESDLAVETGRFGASMQVELVNDGPVTLLLERESPA